MYDLRLTHESNPKGLKVAGEEGPIEGLEAEGGPGEGQTTTEPAQSVETAPQIDYLDIDDELAQRHVRIKVDGEEISVPLREALDGYSRTEDYTRKTQTVAQQRQEAEEALILQQAMRAAPGLAVQVLAQRAGMSVEDFLGLTPKQQQQAVTEPEYDDPLERQLAEERAARLDLERRFAEREADNELQGAYNGLKQRYGIDDNQAREVIATAMQLGLPPQMLPLVYESLAFRRGQVQQQVRQEVGQQQAQQTAQRQAAAQQAGQQISTGTGAVGTTTEGAADGRMSLQEAIASAMDGWVE